jgi:hypothetical protein
MDSCICSEGIRFLEVAQSLGPRLRRFEIRTPHYDDPAHRPNGRVEVNHWYTDAEGSDRTIATVRAGKMPDRPSLPDPSVLRSLHFESEVPSPASNQ